MNWIPGGVLIQLVLDADHIRPGGIVNRPGLVESVRLTIDDQRVVAILRGVDALFVPLDVVPGIRRPARTSDSIEDPTIARTIPCSPVAVAKVALAADHVLFAAEHLPEIELRRPESWGGGVVVDPEIPQKVGIGTGAEHRIDKQHVAPGQPVDIHLKAASALRRLALKRRHPVVGSVVRAMRAVAAGGPVVGAVLHLLQHLRVFGGSGQDGTARRRRPDLEEQCAGGVVVALAVPCACVEKVLAIRQIDLLRDFTGNDICLVHDAIIEVDDPTRNGTGAVCDCIHLDLVRVLTWLWALQPNAGYLSVCYLGQSNQTDERHADKKRGSTTVHVGYHPGEMCGPARGGAKVRNLGRAVKIAYKRSLFENEQPRSFPSWHAKKPQSESCFATL
jgi:hypothetical protein